MQSQLTKKEKRPITREEVLKQIENVKTLGWGRVEVVIADGVIFELNITHKIRAGDVDSGKILHV